MPVSVMVTVAVAVTMFPLRRVVVFPPPELPPTPVAVLIILPPIVVVSSVYFGIPPVFAIVPVPVVIFAVVTLSGYNGLPPIPVPVPGTVTAVTATLPKTIGLFPTVAVMFALTISLPLLLPIILLSPGMKPVTCSVDTGMEKDTKEAPRVVLMMLFSVTVTSGSPTVAVRVVTMDHEAIKREKGGER